MPEQAIVSTETETLAAVDGAAAEEAMVEETLVEEVSIDGMCGVY
ncbi:mycofactocin precursor MftA [Trujillonella humicola]